MLIINILTNGHTILNIIFHEKISSLKQSHEAISEAELIPNLNF